MIHVYLMHVSMIHTYGAYIIDAYGGDPGGYPEHDRGGEEEGEEGLVWADSSSWISISTRRFREISISIKYRID